MFEATGDKGRLEVGYQFAAEFRDWSLSSDHGAMGSLDTVIQGKVVRVDDFWSTQRPMVVKVFMGGKWWKWAVPATEELVLRVDARFEITVTGQPELEEVWHEQK